MVDDNIYWKNDLISTNDNDSHFIQPNELAIYFEICNEYDTNVVKFKLMNKNTDSPTWSQFDGCIVEKDILHNVSLDRFTYRTEVSDLIVCFN